VKLTQFPLTSSVYYSGPTGWIRG